jgi:hypothetical protein
MSAHSLALLFLAAAIPLWSAARVPSLRLAWVSGRALPGTRLWTRITGVRVSGSRSARLLLAGALGSLTAVSAS